MGAITKIREDRHPSESYEDILEKDSKAIPDHLRQGPVMDLGREGIPVTDFFDRDHYQKEIRHVWLKVWQWACREEEIPEAGDIFVYENVGKSVMIIRQEDGSIRAFYNSCLHRGRKLVDESCRKSELRCKFHGLAWTSAGEYKDNPIPWDFPQMTPETMRLPQIKVECWGGFVFINFDPHAKPLMDTIKALAEHFDRYDFANRYKAVHVSKVVPCNWKVMAEAFMESWHTVATHPQLLHFLGDVNSQYDILSDDVSRQFTATGVLSPLLADRNFDEPHILRSMNNVGGSHIAGGKGHQGKGPSAKPKLVRAREMTDAPETLPEGMTARKYAAEATRKLLGTEDGYDYSQCSDAEMLDALLYNVFPHMSFWAGYAPNLIYRWRPNGLDTESSIMDVIILKRVPKNGVRPKPAPEHRLALEEDWSDAAELGGLAAVFEQDMENLPHVQLGLHTSGTGVVHFAMYSEMRIRQMHQKIARLIAEGEAKDKVASA